MQNFNPALLATHIAALLARVDNVEKMITGDVDFKASEVFSVVNGLVAVVGDFVPRIAEIEKYMAIIVPIIPALQDTFAGSVAGQGDTALSGAVIPADEIGAYVDPAKLDVV
jgi:hypothetical protein